jgi:hypothetical protein
MLINDFDHFGQRLSPRPLPVLLADEQASLPKGLKRTQRARRADQRRRFERGLLDVPLFRLGR